MVGKGDKRLKAIAGVTTNILNTINEDGREDNENVTPNATPRCSILPPPHESGTAWRKMGASTSTAEEASAAVKKILEEWLTSTLNNILNKPVQKESRNTAQADITTINGEQLVPQIGNTYTTIDADNDALAVILK